MLLRSGLAALCLLFVTAIGSSTAAPSLDGVIFGIELCPQSVCGAAIFAFEYQGLVNGQLREGWGWIVATHEDLPTDQVNVALIHIGFGAIYVGSEQFDVAVQGGALLLIDEKDPLVFDDVFGVTLFVAVCNSFGQCSPHTFNGLLSHETLTPWIAGGLNESEDGIEKPTVVSLNLDSADNGGVAWADRVGNVVDLITSHRADIVGFQELANGNFGTADFQADLEALLRDNYQFITFEDIPDVGGPNPNQNAILINADRFTFTGIGGIDPVPAGSRVVYTHWAILEDNDSGQPFVVYNTHFIFGSEDDRYAHASAIVQLMNENAAVYGDLPVIMTGDLNINDDRPGFEGTTDAATIDLLKNAGLVDTFLPGEGSIDWVLVSSEWTILENAILDTDVEHENVSDHFPVITTIEIAP